MYLRKKIIFTLKFNQEVIDMRQCFWRMHQDYRYEQTHRKIFRYFIWYMVPNTNYMEWGSIWVVMTTRMKNALEPFQYTGVILPILLIPVMNIKQYQHNLLMFIPIADKMVFILKWGPRFYCYGWWLIYNFQLYHVSLFWIIIPVICQPLRMGHITFNLKWIWMDGNHTSNILASRINGSWLT